jgi:hypothetical protein
MGHLQVPTGDMKGLESKPLIGRIMKERKEKEWRKKRGERREEKEGMEEEGKGERKEERRKEGGILYGSLGEV